MNHHARHRGHTRGYHFTSNSGQQQSEPAYTLLLQLAPILFLVLLSLLSSFLVSDPVFSLEPTQKYSTSRETQNLRVPYFVKADFHTEYKGSLRRLEQQVEEEYLSSLRANCFRERSYKENLLWRARNYNDAKLYARAQDLKTPSCDKLNEIYS
jgi:DnaJ family protein B protein 12